LKYKKETTQKPNHQNKNPKFKHDNQSLANQQKRKDRKKQTK